MKVLIIEDEMMARRSLEKMLEANFPDIEVVGGMRFGQRVCSPAQGKARRGGLDIHGCGTF